MENEMKLKIEDLREQAFNLRTFDPKEEINSYCDELLSQVTLTVESVNKCLNKMHEKLVAEIETYRSELLAPFEVKLPREGDLGRLEAKMDETKLEISRLVDRVQKLDSFFHACNNSRNLFILKEANELPAEIKRNAETIRKLTFQEKFMTFKPTVHFPFESNLVGSFDFASDESAKKALKTVKQVQSLQLGCHEELETRKSVAFLPNENLAVSDGTEKVLIWSLKLGECVATLRNSTAVSVLACLPNGHLTVCLVGQILNIWDVTKKTLIRTIGEWGIDTVISTRVLSNGCFATYSKLGALKVYDSDLSKSIVFKTFDDDEQNLLMSRFDVLSNGFFVTCAYRDSSPNALLKIWSPKDGKLVHKIQTHVSFVSSLLALENDNVLVNSLEGVMCIYDLVEECLLQRFELGCSKPQLGNVVRLNDGHILLSCDLNLQIWDPTSGRLVTSIPSEHTRKIRCLGASPDNNFIATVGADQFLKVYSLG